MANMTLSVPDELQAKLKTHPEIVWSEVARKAMAEKVEQLELFEKLVAKSKLTEKDAFEIGEKIKEGMHKRLKAELAQKK
jgi:hypothetical protein